ncbi:MAG: hypothetical protein ACK6BG_14975 [Cyanobacteriota bacterium]
MCFELQGGDQLQVTALDLSRQAELLQDPWLIHLSVAEFSSTIRAVC